MVGAMTYVVIRDGFPGGYSTPVSLTIVGVFWLGVVALIPYAAAKPCLTAVVDGRNTVHAVWRYPHRAVRLTISGDDIGRAQVVEQKDSENDPYYVSRANTVDGIPLDLKEGHNRAACENACLAFNHAVFGDHVARP